MEDGCERVKERSSNGGMELKTERMEDSGSSHEVMSRERRRGRWREREERKEGGR